VLKVTSFSFRLKAASVKTYCRLPRFEHGMLTTARGAGSVWYGQTSRFGVKRALLWEADSVTHVVYKFPSVPFAEPQGSLSRSRGPSTGLCTPSAHAYLEWCVPIRLCGQNSVHISFFISPIHATCPTHFSSWFGHPNNIRRAVYLKLPITLFPPSPPCALFVSCALGSNIFSWLCSQTASVFGCWRRNGPTDGLTP
jgi:hypothetical protein